MTYLSIIIPHFNSPSSLKKLLDSIPKLDEIQIIVIDDNSNEEVEELNQLISSSVYSRVNFIVNDTNTKGAGVCRNIGLDKAEGEWLLFADSDDFFTKDFYYNISHYLESDNDVVFFTPTSVEIDTGNLSDRHVHIKKIIESYSKNKDLNSETSLRYRIVVPWCKMIRRSFLKENEIFFDEVIASNDVMFSAKIGYHMQKFEVSKKVIYCVTRRRGSLTTNTSHEVYDSRLMVHINYCQYLRNNLKKDELEMFNLNGRAFIINAVKYKLGFRKIFSTYILLKKNNITLFDLRFLNPVFLISKTLFHYRSLKKQKKYLVK